MNHTPGPFTVQHFNDEPTPCICAGDGDIRLATLEAGATDGDADLFAAAPELLEALKSQARHVETFLRRDGCSQETIDYYIEHATAAIAKAEGRTT